MGLLKKIRSRPNPARSLYSRRTSKTSAAQPSSGSHPEVQPWAVQVMSVPVAYSPDSARSFNWMTNKMDDFECHEDTPCEQTKSTCQDAGMQGTTKSLADRQDSPWGGLLWLTVCFTGGTTHLVEEDKAGDQTASVTNASSHDPSVQSDCDDDESADSTQPSVSLANKELKLERPDDVSDVTSVASVDDSDSESDISTTCSTVRV